MPNISISIFGNQILSEIINEIKLFSKYEIKFYDNLNLCTKNAKYGENLVIFFLTKVNEEDYKKIEKNNFPLILITKSPRKQKILPDEFVEQMIMPFSMLDLEIKIVSLLARFKFRKSSLINLRGYTINKNERKIKKNNLELQLTEKEVNFLILFSKNDKPLARNFILKSVWNYSSETDTHTIETHIHRLRKKMSEKFNDNNFIKNNNEGYYI
mgnify:CR=1 FL=1